MSRRLQLTLAVSLGAGALATLTLFWVGSGASRIPSGTPSIHGMVTRVTAAGGAGAVLVEENPQDSGGSAKASVTVTAATRIWIGQGSGARAGQFADLRTGQRVEVWFTGPVLESYPVQATASAIVILASS